MDVNSIFQTLSNGSFPDGSIEISEEGNLIRSVTRSARDDVLVVQRVREDIYKIMRVSPKEESQSKTIQRVAKNPRRSVRSGSLSNMRKVDHFNYQTVIARAPEFTNDQNPTHRTVNEVWNGTRRNHKPIETALSARDLVNAWNRLADTY